MKQGLTHLIFVVDRSASMSSIASEMITGYNQFIKKQKENASECYVSFYQFDDQYDTVFERVALTDVKELNDDTYQPRGSTALFDAMGNTINNYGKYLSELPEDQRPERILFVTITDGENNTSKIFTLEQVANMVKHQTEVYSWDFVFLGSNIDAWSAGSTMNFRASSTMQFANVGGSVRSAFDSLAKNTMKYRASSIKADYSFDTTDYAAQDNFLDETLKSKNKTQQTTPPVKASK